jgi:hypothetical protein
MDDAIIVDNFKISLTRGKPTFDYPGNFYFPAVQVEKLRCFFSPISGIGRDLDINAFQA